MRNRRLRQWPAVQAVAATAQLAGGRTGRRSPAGTGRGTPRRRSRRGGSQRAARPRGSHSLVWPPAAGGIPGRWPGRTDAVADRRMPAGAASDCAGTLRAGSGIRGAVRAPARGARRRVLVRGAPRAGRIAAHEHEDPCLPGLRRVRLLLGPVVSRQGRRLRPPRRQRGARTRRPARSRSLDRTASTGFGTPVPMSTPRVRTFGTPYRSSAAHFVPYVLEGEGALWRRGLFDLALDVHVCDAAIGPTGLAKRIPAGGRADRPDGDRRRAGDHRPDPMLRGSGATPQRVRCRPGHAGRYESRGRSHGRGPRLLA